MAKEHKARGEFRVVLAAGAVLWRDAPNGRQIAIIFRRRYSDEWSLPKGKLEQGETFEQAVVRELREETCCDGVLLDLISPLGYRVPKGPKVVLFYEMELQQEHPFEPSAEVEELDWVLPEEAILRLTYPDEARIVEQWAAGQVRRRESG